MAFTFIDIEQRTQRIIVFLFLFMLAFYFFGAGMIYLAVRVLSPLTNPYRRFPLFPVPARHIWMVFAVSLAAVSMQWYFSVVYGRGRILRILKARPPDGGDTYHRKLINIVEEVSVATGGRNIGCVVIPDYAMNSFSLMDFRSEPVIGITEGLLSRLTRPQLEAVVAHEAAHIVSGDAVLKTVAFSLFGVYGTVLRCLCDSLKSSGRYSSRRKGGNPGLAVVLIAVTWTVHTVSRLLCMFISRQCEYKADAAAVRLCRDPLSLAQALHRISRGWRGSGLGYEDFSGLFIVNPAYSELDETEGVLANMFSTHPPLAARTRVLLDMAHTDYATMARSAGGMGKVRHEEVSAVDVKEPRWYLAGDGNEWKGPFSALEISAMKDVRHDCFIRKEGTVNVNFLYMDPGLTAALKTARAHPAGAPSCPRCGGVLSSALYEGVPLKQCSLCKGVLLKQGKIPRILIREDRGFSDAVIRQARLLTEQSAKRRTEYGTAGVRSELVCPDCGQRMLRGFYSTVYFIEVDTCYSCKAVWFDRDELEVLQCMIEETRANSV